MDSVEAGEAITTYVHPQKTKTMIMWAGRNRRPVSKGGRQQQYGIGLVVKESIHRRGYVYSGLQPSLNRLLADGLLYALSYAR